MFMFLILLWMIPSSLCESLTMFMFLILLWMIPLSICVDYQIIATIIPGLHSGTADKQFVTIKGKAPVEKECSANFNVDNQDVTCSVQTGNAIEDYKCLLWRTDGDDGMDLSKIKVIADNTVIHLIEPPQDATVIAITGPNSYVFCHQQPRQREQGEIVPVSAEQSKTKGLETVKALFNAELAIDLNHASGCTAVPDGTGVSYVKLNFGKVYCVEKVTWYRNGEMFKTWTCNQKGCSSDNGAGYTLTVYSEGGGGGGQPNPCQHGDTVKLAREGGRVLSVAEISVIARPDADCTSADSTWKHVQTDTSLPVTHGVEITLSCPADYTNKGGDKVTCWDGNVVPTGQSPNCRAKCMTFNEDLKITVTDPQLPAEDGASINYRCSKKYAKKGGNVNLVCDNGIVTFSGGNTPCFKIGNTIRPGEYQQFSDERSESDFSSCDLEAGDTAKHIEVKRWLKVQEQRDKAREQCSQLTKHKIAVPHQFLPVTVQAWRDEEDDEVRRQHRPAWEIAAEQHPALAMKNTARPPLPTPVHQTRVDYAKQYYRDRMAMFVGLVMIMIGVATWAIAVTHQSPISRWMGCVIIVVGVGWLIVDCINVKTRRKS